MIKGNVVVRGKISHAAVLRTSKQGEVFTSMSVKVCLPNGAENPKECIVSVRMKGGTSEELAQYEIGISVEISGMLTFRKTNEELYLNLCTECVMVSDGTKPDSITGEIEFYGNIGSVPEIKKDKNGNEYLYFSAYSTEQVGEERMFTWVRFIRFSGKKEDFLVKGNGIHLTGALDILFYHDRMNLGCRFTEAAQWGKSKVDSE